MRISYSINTILCCLPLLIASGCNSKQRNETKLEEIQTEGLKIDQILGDKKEGDSIIRFNNFNAFKTLIRPDLSANSEHYNIHKLSDSIYVVSPRKVYEKTRIFTAILKLSKDSVVKTKVIDDLSFKDFLIEQNEIQILLGNFGIFNAWQVKNEIVLFTFSHDLELKWEYRLKDKEFNFEALGLAKKNNSTLLNFNLITGCDICYLKYTLTLNELGIPKEYELLEKVNSTFELNSEQENSLFKIS